MCFKTEWEFNKPQLSWICLMLNLVIVYLYVGVLAQHVYVLVQAGNSYDFASLFTLLAWIEGTCSFVLISDVIFVMCSMESLFTVAITFAFLLSVVLLISGSFSVVVYTDTYAVVRGYYSEKLYYYEMTHECCGMNGPKDYGNPISNDTLPLSCFKNRKADYDHIYTRGCLNAVSDSWFWFIFSNCYWVAFVLILVDVYAHIKLRQRL